MALQAASPLAQQRQQPLAVAVVVRQGHFRVPMADLVAALAQTAIQASTVMDLALLLGLGVAVVPVVPAVKILPTYQVCQWAEHLRRQAA